MYFMPIIYHNISCRRKLLLPLYRKLSDNSISSKSGSRISDKIVAYSVLPETTFSGGLSDRFRGIVSVYKECKNQNIPFKIYFGNLNLTDYLIPNKYNWAIDCLDFDIKDAYPCTILTHHSNINNKLQKFAQKVMLKHHIKHDSRQIHVYTNMATGDDEYASLFHELFKPSPELQSIIDHHLTELGGPRKYDAIVFRFRQLLGDFKEGGEILDPEDQIKYMNRCLDYVRQEHIRNPQKTLLITSDSRRFLDSVGKLPYVYIIPGNVVHIGFTFDADKMTYMKSFVDYYVLSFAHKITLIRDNKMYHSGFALRAALLNNAKYEESYL